MPSGAWLSLSVLNLRCFTWEFLAVWSLVGEKSLVSVA